MITTSTGVLGELTHDVVSRLVPEFLTQEIAIDLDGVRADFARELPLDDARLVIDEAMRRFPDHRARSDAWLGPRLHDAIRLTRREAARRGIWRFLGVVEFDDYVRWRFGGTSDDGDPTPAKLERFVGGDYSKHALTRLWWMAELFRNGPDYSPAEKGLSNQDLTNNLFKMDIAHHRPIALGAVEVLQSEGGREANALAKAMNAAATTLVVDLIAPDAPFDDAARESWLEDATDRDPTLTFDTLPAGPNEPQVPANSLETMTDLLRALLAEAPVRVRRPRSRRRRTERTHL